VENIGDKQKKFAEEYTKDFNGTQAAIRAGYSAKTAKTTAARLLTYENIQEYLGEFRKKSTEKAQITQDMIVEGYRRLAFFDSRKFYKDGKPIKVDELDDETAYALSGFEVSEMTSDFGSKISTSKVKMSDRNRALDSLCRVLGFNAPDKTALVNPDGSAAKQSPILSDTQFDKLINLLNK
jgi:phage terminase small subunit